MMERTDTATGYAAELGSLRKEQQRVDSLRIEPGITDEQRRSLEEESLLLRRRERELVAAIGKEVAAAIEASAGALKELSGRIKATSARMGRNTARLDKAGKVAAAVARGGKAVPKKGEKE